ncbi:ABC transporter transmembrane domain-containing protein [Pseudonocardia phyllosphaerae]|uniref:ABC transporter transmembrane domain-containing protein n=1 Tax=Pseudonocardia phyllosphaerae TaxID=3390502 RepID=UPI00397BBDC5
MLGQAPAEPPDVEPFAVGAGDTPGRFLGRVLFSLPRVTVPALLLAVVWQVGESAVPLVMGVAIDRSLSTGDAGQLVVWLGVLVSVYVALTAAARLGWRLTVYAEQLVQHRLRATLSARVLHPGDRAGREGAARTPDGAVVSVMTSDTARLGAAGLVVQPVAQVAAIGFIAVSLLLIHWLVGLVVLVGASVVVWLMGVLGTRFSRDTRGYQGLLASTVARASDIVAGYRVVKGIRAEAEAARRYRLASQEALVGARRNAGLLGGFLFGTGALTGVFVATVTGLAGWFAVDGRLSIGQLIAVVGLTQALLPQIQALAQGAAPSLAAARASSARVLGVLRGDDPGTAGLRGAPAGRTRIDATQVPALDIELLGSTVRVEPGELVGVRADDRTAARLAEALLDPHAGSDSDNGIEVRLGGRPAQGLSPADYRSWVTVAPHRTTLFTGTIRDNLGPPARADGRGPELVDAAVEAAACTDFAGDLDLPVGEDGNRLSGGQRQRVALARALSTDAPVLVLHDPTTAVDPVTEQAVAERLAGIRAGRSNLVIASSPTLLQHCDRVVDLLEQGRAADGDLFDEPVAP